MQIHGVNEVAKNLQALAGMFRSQKLQNKMGLAAQRKMKKLTRSGKDAEGRSFPSAPTADKGPYSRGHRKRRERGHGRGKALQVAKKDLIFSEQGGMMDVMDQAVSSDLESVAIFFDSPEKSEIAAFLMAGAGTSRVKHNFFTLSDSSVDEIGDLVDLEVDKYLTLSNLKD